MIGRPGNVREDGLGGVSYHFEDSHHIRAVAALFAEQGGDIGFQADAADLFRCADRLDDEDES